MAPRTKAEAGLDAAADAVVAASRVLVAVAARSLSGHEADVSISQYRALVVLATRGAQRPVDLATALGVDPSTVTRQCDRLAAKDLISRHRDEVDRRVVRLSLTARGRALFDDVTRSRRREIRRILTQVAPADRVELMRAFAAFNRAAGEAPDDEARVWEI